jgi:hypothetical protein
MKTVALAIAVLVVPVAAEAAPKHHRPHVSQAARGSYAAQPQIACTQVGCLPVPRGCYPRGGRTFSGRHYFRPSLIHAPALSRAPSLTGPTPRWNAVGPPPVLR